MSDSETFQKAVEMMQGTSDNVVQEQSTTVSASTPIDVVGQSKSTPSDAKSSEKPATTPNSVATTEQELISPKFAALAKRERSLLEKERELKKIEEEIKLRQQEEELWEKDPFKALEKRGLDYEKLTKRLLNSNNPSPEDKLTAVEKKLLEIEQKEKEKEQQQLQQRVEQTINSFKQEIASFVKQNTEKYELINAMQTEQLIYDVTEQHYHANGEILPIEKACDLVENYLEEQATKIVGLKKVQAKWTPPDKVEKPSASPIAESKTETITLTNDATTSPRVTSLTTDEDAITTAIKHLKFT